MGVALADAEGQPAKHANLEASADDGEPELLARARERLLSLLFDIGGYPHEVLTVAMGKAVYGTRRGGGIAADLEMVESQHGEQPLSAVFESFSRQLSAKAVLPGCALERVGVSLAAFGTKLALPFRRLAEERTPRDAFTISNAPSELLDRNTGGSTLTAFAWIRGQTVGQQMFRWCENVARRLRTRLGCDGQALYE